MSSNVPISQCAVEIHAVVRGNVTEGKLRSAGPHDLPVEPTVQFCDFCHDTVYRTLLVRVGDGSVVREGQIRKASGYRKACPPCADRMREALHRASVAEELGKMLEEMVGAGAGQRELDEYIVGWGLDASLVKGFGVPEVDTGRYG